MNPPNPFLVASVFPSDLAPSTERMPSPAGSSSGSAPTEAMMMMMEVPAPGVSLAPVAIHVSASADAVMMDDATSDDAAPTRADLLQRAAELGPSRLTWENIVLQPTDPILANKMQPRVAERRARFRRVVKVALGACVAFCVVATAASALSSSHPSDASAAAGKSAPATGDTPVEKLDQTTRGKAPHVVTAARPAVPTRAKRR